MGSCWTGGGIDCVCCDSSLTVDRPSVDRGSLVMLLFIGTGTDDIGLAGAMVAVEVVVGSTTVTRNREFGKKLVGEQLFDEGGVMGDVPASTTRDTWNRLRDGLGTGEDTGDGIGLGKGERKRPPDFRFGSNR